MRRTGHRVLVHTGSRCKKAGDEIKLRLVGTARHNDAPHRQRAQAREVRFHRPHSGRRIEFHQIIERTAADEHRFGAQGFHESCRSCGRFGHFCREIHLDPGPVAPRREQPADCVKERGIGGRYPARLPKNVSTGEGGMTAERDFDRRCEPAEPPAVVLRVQEGCLRKIHFLRDLLHPGLVARRRQQADRRRIASERLIGESIDLIDGEAHGL